MPEIEEVGYESETIYGPTTIHGWSVGDKLICVDEPVDIGNRGWPKKGRVYTIHSFRNGGFLYLIDPLDGRITGGWYRRRFNKVED